GGVEGLLARAADPEIALARLGHLDHALFHGAGANHDGMDAEAKLGGQELVAGADPRRRGSKLAIVPARHGRVLLEGRVGPAVCAKVYSYYRALAMARIERAACLRSSPCRQIRFISHGGEEPCNEYSLGFQRNSLRTL